MEKDKIKIDLVIEQLASLVWLQYKHDKEEGIENANIK
ncbi:hypothetical protein SAMN05421659_102245 [[Clostridium] fimetarium]|uniref:Uncharacterized protein n=1 Tax=[Clostridium] fimetarium TaxID=99656 RepID=A0A1I0MY45_9FIRM|nr:hypothetical protein SAMN05421659_102245 [[Clostridium] fimetarium]